MNGRQHLKAVGLALIFASAAYGEFIPGHIFVSDNSPKFCMNGDQWGWDRIWEIDPQTGAVSLFVELRDQDCGYISGLAFSPDGTRLRASLYLKDQIVEFDSAGNMTVVLDSGDSILGPWGWNNLLYDADEMFYVLNHSARNLIRFPTGGGPGAVFADNDDGINGRAALALASNGDIYCANTIGGNYVLRITPEGVATVFEDFGNTNPPAVAADDSGHVYIGLENADLYKYDASDPASKELLVSFPFGSSYAMTMSLNQRQLYVASMGIGVFVVDVLDRSVTQLAEIAEGGIANAGIVVVPGTPPGIPAMSQWGLAILGLLTLSMGTILLRTRCALMRSTRSTLRETRFTQLIPWRKGR